MVAYTTTRTTIYQQKIQAHFILGGMVANRANAVNASAVIHAKEHVADKTSRWPGRKRASPTGPLAKSIQSNGGGVAAKYTYNTTMFATSPHAGWVEHGTLDKVIRPTVKKRMRLPPGAGFKKKLKKKVRGQKPKRFLEKGMNDALKAAGYKGQITRLTNQLGPRG